MTFGCIAAEGRSHPPVSMKNRPFLLAVTIILTGCLLDVACPQIAEWKAGPMAHEEWHVTVGGDPTAWQKFIGAIDQRLRDVTSHHYMTTRKKIKPIHIELNSFERHVMCAANFDPSHLIDILGHDQFRVLRVKHEVQAPPGIDIATHSCVPIYYECHIKLDGPFVPYAPLASRDLYREKRWYVTRRMTGPFDPQPFVDEVTAWAGQYGGLYKVVGWEYEACLQDTNPGLDAKWTALFYDAPWADNRTEGCRRVNAHPGSPCNVACGY